MIKLLKSLVLWVITFTLFTGAALAANNLGDDLVQKFQGALKGEPLRVVAIGGSITQAGKGWINDWLKQSFPNTSTALHNAGLSATGSTLGMFRVERDVISFQPDIVLIEFAVNDGSTSDQRVILGLESIIHRLKKLPNPPAIVFIETASKYGSNVKRHARVAAHYNFVDINLQTRIDAYLKEKNQDWSAYYGDAVHPNNVGHKLYSDFITEVLDKYLAKAKTAYTPSPYSLPEKISSRKLILDGIMFPLPLTAGWKQQPYLTFWYSRAFNGFLMPEKYPAILTIPVQGSIVGIFYALSKNEDYGSMLANVDGASLNLYSCNHRGGYSYSIVADNLKNQQHLLNIAIPEKLKGKAGPMLGYILAGGFSDPDAQSRKLAPQGKFSAEKLAKIEIHNIPANVWRWSGPYGDISSKQSDEQAHKSLATLFPPEKSPNSVNNWKEVAQEGDFIDFSKLMGFKDRGVNYARTTVSLAKKATVILGLSVDYWAKIWVNGEEVLNLNKTHGPVKNRTMVEVEMNKGDNTILIKTHAGSAGNGFSLIYAPEP